MTVSYNSVSYNRRRDDPPLRIADESRLPPHYHHTSRTDIPRVAELFQLSEEGVDPEAIFGWTSRTHQDRPYLHILCAPRGQIIGAIGGKIEINPFPDADLSSEYVAVIDDVAVRRDSFSRHLAGEYELKRVGTTLVELFEAQARQAGAGAVDLEVYARCTSAIEFHRRNGYNIIAEGIKDDPEYLPERLLRMRKSLERPSD